MSDKPISALPVAPDLVDADAFPLVHDGQTSQISWLHLKQFLIRTTNIGQVRTVGKSGPVDYNTIQAACNSITDAAPDKRYTILVFPGIYNEHVVLPDYVSLRGLSADFISDEALGVVLVGDNLLLEPGFESVIDNIFFFVHNPIALGATRYFIRSSQGCSIQNCHFFAYENMANDPLIVVEHSYHASMGGRMYFDNCHFVVNISDCPSLVVILDDNVNATKLSRVRVGELQGATSLVFFSRSRAPTSSEFDALGGVLFEETLFDGTVLFQNAAGEGTYVAQAGSSAPQPNIAGIDVVDGAYVHPDYLSPTLGLTAPP